MLTIGKEVVVGFGGWEAAEGGCEVLGTGCGGISRCRGSSRLKGIFSRSNPCKWMIIFCCC